MVQSNILSSLASIATPESTILFVPTSTVLPVSILKTIQNDVSSFTPLSTYESVLVVVHNMQCDWLLPGVKATGRRLVVPIVVVPVVEEGVLIEARFYWDQASVLKQIGILPHSLYCKANGAETVLPIVGVKIADMLLMSTTSVAPVEQEQEQKTPVNQRQRVLAQSKSMSGLLAGYEVDNSVRPSTRVFTKPDSLNIFTDVPIPQPHISRRDPNESSLSAANSRPGTGRRDPNERSGSSGMVGQSMDEGVHTGKKMTHGVNASHFSLDSDVQVLGEDMDQMMMNKKHVSGSTKSHFTLAPTGSPAHVSTIHKKLVVDNPNYVSHWKIDGEGGEEPEFATGKKMGGGPGGVGEEAWHYGKKMGKEDKSSVVPLAVFERPSSRVLAPPGGMTSVFIG